MTVHNNGTAELASGTARSRGGALLHDTSHHRFTFPAFSLCGGCSVRIHTGSGTNGAHNLYWGSANYIWNNTGDTATLVEADRGDP